MKAINRSKQTEAPLVYNEYEDVNVEFEGKTYIVEVDSEGYVLDESDGFLDESE